MPSLNERAAMPREDTTDQLVRATFARYENVRIGGRTGFSFFRCIDCRCLIEPILNEQQLHDSWHERHEAAPTTPPAAAADW